MGTQSIKSLNGKIMQAFTLSSRIADRIDAGEITEDGLDIDLVYGHADGLSAKRLYNIRDGCCSLRASMDFDPEAEETRLDEEINYMTVTLQERCT